MTAQPTFESRASGVSFDAKDEAMKWLWGIVAALFIWLGIFAYVLRAEHRRWKQRQEDETLARVWAMGRASDAIEKEIKDSERAPALPAADAPERNEKGNEDD